MKEQGDATGSINLGPFLSLLVLATSGWAVCKRNPIATARTITWQSSGQTWEGRPELATFRGNATYLGPFLTLILTLHRAKNGTDARSGRSAWQPSPFVRIGTSP